VHVPTSLGPSKSITPPPVKIVAGVPFLGYGSHTNEAYPPGPYLTAACALGITKDEVEEFLRRLDRTLSEFPKKRGKSRGKGLGDTRGKEGTAGAEGRR
jgi:hypothetical protein